jgi:hypothetical protein
MVQGQPRIKAPEAPQPPSQPVRKKMDIVVAACHPSYKGSINISILVQANQGTNSRPYLKNNRSEKG